MGLRVSFLTRQAVTSTAAVVSLFIGALVSSLVSSPLSAQTPTPTSEQLDIYKNLPPDQQKAILETLGRGSASAKSGVKTDQPLEFPDTMMRRSRDDDEPTDEEARNQEPRLKSEDTVLLSLEVRRFEETEEAKRAAAQQRADQQRAPAQPPAPAAPATPGEKIRRTEAEEKRLSDLREKILRRNPYRLDQQGVLNVGELGPIPLAGLTVEEARKRLAAELSLKDFVIELTYLPLKAQGREALKPFGYDLFAGAPTTFAPATDVPVPAEYMVGPGDTMQVQLTGTFKGSYGLVVGRDGRINFPEIGPISVAGMRFPEARELLRQRVARQLSGTQVSVELGELRSIRVFVLGDAEVPGSYTVGGLSTITNALFVSGGVKKIGSLRNIELRRDGNVVTRLDLYDLLLKGDTRADVRLLPGDVIFIPPVGPTVGLYGEVRRPAIYELKGDVSVKELIELGGGFTPEADPKLTAIERINDVRQKTTLDVDLSSPQAGATPIRTGDYVRVLAVRPTLEGSVQVSGHVYRTGTFQHREGMRLTDILSSLDELKPNADQHYVLIRRELPPDRITTVFSADLSAALAARGSAGDIPLAPRDRIVVFDRDSGRDAVVQPLMRELRLQSRHDAPAYEVEISGRVKVPGQYPLEPGMRVADLIRAGGSLEEGAYEPTAELTRYTVGSGDERKAELITIDLRRALVGDASANIQLLPHDYLVVKEVPEWQRQEQVEIQGEVRFPGKYPIRRGETLRSVLARAGGPTDIAFLEGGVFTRKTLKERERQQVDMLTRRLESDLAQLSLQASQETGRDASQALTVGQSLLSSLRSTEPVGRLVVDLEKIASMRASSAGDIVMKDGDKLVVPRTAQEVTVIGEVQSATSHLHIRGIDRDEYIRMSGGVTQRADKSRIYVVRANGSVIASEGNSWFSSASRMNMQPGDTVVVPLDAERMRALPMWQSITTIIYNLAIAAAAVNSF